MQTRLLVIRHGETIWNKEHRLQGNLDSPLSALGKQQSQALGKRIAEEHIDFVLTSPLGRAQQTTQLILDQRNDTIPVQHVDTLKERSFGMFEGMTFADIKEQFPDFSYNEATDRYLWMPPDGENYELLEKRVHPYIERLIEDQQGKSILIVTHGGVVRSILSHFGFLKQEDWFSIFIENTSLSIIEQDEEGKISCPIWNDASHLEYLVPEDMRPNY